MNKLKIIQCIVVYTLISAPLHGVTGKTFLMPRATGQDLVLEQAMTYQFIHRENPEPGFIIASTLFYQESTNPTGLARYFLPNNKTQLVIKGATAGGAAPDVSATWLQIAGVNTKLPVAAGNNSFATAANAALYLNEFQSKISIRPEIKSFGAMVQLHKSFDFLNNKVWASALLPFMQMETNAHLREFDVKNAISTVEAVPIFSVRNSTPPVTVRRIEQATASTPLNATQGFNNPDWRYGKIKNGTQKLAGLADIKLMLGYAPLANQFGKINVYGIGTIPMGYKPRSEFLVEPLVGNGRHFALGFGLSGDVKLYTHNCSSFDLMSSLEYNYLFQSCEMRSFDLLANGQWSRYLLVFQPNNLNFAGDPGNVPKPGINFFTKDLKVTPQSQVNWLTSLRYVSDRFGIEVGYNLWWKDQEHVRLAKTWDEQISLARIDFISTPAINPFTIQSFPQATISSATNQLSGTPAAPVTLVTQSDLNIASAANPSVLSHKIYMAMNVGGSCCQNIWQFGLGSSYEFADGNCTIDQWGIWMKCNLSV